MNYTEAVALAKAGDERGYGFLYETTYKSKYYLALQYVKNEETARDVLQEYAGRAGGVSGLAGKDRGKYGEERSGKKESHAVF